MCGTPQDITEFKLLQLELSRTTRLEAIGRLAGGIAHDFNNVLSVILGRVELAMASVDPDSDVMTDLAEISAAAQRSAELTSQLLTFARQQAVEPVVLDVNHRIDGVVTLVERLIGDTVTISWEPATDLWSVRSDPSQVDQILTNLTCAVLATSTNPGVRLNCVCWPRSITFAKPRRSTAAHPEDVIRVGSSERYKRPRRPSLPRWSPSHPRRGS